MSIQYGPYNRRGARSSRDSVQREYERFLTQTPEGRSMLKDFHAENPLMSRREAKRALAVGLKEAALDRLRSAQPSWRQGLSLAETKSDSIVDTGVTKKRAKTSIELNTQEIVEPSQNVLEGEWREVTDCDGNTFSVWCRAS